CRRRRRHPPPPHLPRAHPPLARTSLRPPLKEGLSLPDTPLKRGLRSIRRNGPPRRSHRHPTPSRSRHICLHMFALLCVSAYSDRCCVEVGTRCAARGGRL